MTHRDELLADGGVYRAYSDGRQEWRRRLPDGAVEWQDATGGRGVDTPLGPLVKRATADGRVSYGREVGFGRTVWPDAVTVNASAFGGRFGPALTRLSGRLLPDPPATLS